MHLLFIPPFSQFPNIHSIQCFYRKLFYSISFGLVSYTSIIRVYICCVIIFHSLFLSSWPPGLLYSSYRDSFCIDDDSLILYHFWPMDTQHILFIFMSKAKFSLCHHIAFTNVFLCWVIRLLISIMIWFVIKCIKGCIFSDQYMKYLKITVKIV